MMRGSNYKIFFACLVLTVLFLAGCGAKIQDTTVIAAVNDKSIYLKDLKRELSNRVRQNPSLEINKKAIDEMMDTLVKKELIIQEAMAKGMPKEQSFVDTIKSFWEQTLIRNFVEYKNREFERYVFVTDKEVEDYYAMLQGKAVNIPPLEEIRDKLKEAIKNRKMSRTLEDWLLDKKEKSRIRIHQNVISEALK